MHCGVRDWIASLPGPMTAGLERYQLQPPPQQGNMADSDGKVTNALTGQDVAHIFQHLVDRSKVLQVFGIKQITLRSVLCRCSCPERTNFSGTSQAKLLVMTHQTDNVNLLGR